MIIATFLSFPIFKIVEKYFFADWEFLKFLFVLVIGDTVLGFYKHFKHKTLSSKAWGKIINKLISYGSLLIVSHVLGSFTIKGETIHSFGWLHTLVFASLMVKEGISIIENIGAINENLVPKWLLKKLKEFDKNGKFKAD